MTTINYLPRGDNTHKVCNVLDTYEGLYQVGSAARKKIYDLQSSINDFDFVIDTTPDCQYLDDIKCLFEREGLDVALGTWGNYAYSMTVDAGGYEVKIRVEPLSEFLLGTLYAGDGVAVRVMDGRVLCTPEYITVPPSLPVRERAEGEAEYSPRHLEVLRRFEQDLLALAERLSNASNPVTA